MNTVEEFISNKNNYRHHALLLVSNYFSTNTLPENSFKSILQEFCGIFLHKNQEESIYSSYHPDIFVADRERKILRLEDIKKIREFSLYPPQQGLKRLFFIENCERLNINAANSLLKVLEEPATSCLFLLTSRKLSLVLPTISSRVQKVALTFPDLTQKNKDDIFSSEDVQWIQNKINCFHIKNVNQNTIKIKELSDVISRCEKLAKEYETEDLKALLVHLMNEKLKSDFSFHNVCQLFLAQLSSWKDVENYNPSTFLWLSGLFLKFL